MIWYLGVLDKILLCMQNLRSACYVVCPVICMVYVMNNSNIFTSHYPIGEVLWVPGGSNNFFTFAPLDDVVMGGASASAVDNYSGIWRGTVTDANNGGFVGIRSMPFKKGISALDMSNCKGIELRIRKGDGKRFKFVVRDSTEFNGICWTTEFDAAAKNGNKGTTIRIPFDKQIPTMFAKTMDEKRFNEENAVGFQLAYSKFAYDNKLNENFDLGEFVLQILELKSY